MTPKINSDPSTAPTEEEPQDKATKDLDDRFYDLDDDFIDDGDLDHD